MMMPSVNLSLLGLLLVVVPVLSSYMGEDYNDVYAGHAVDNHVYSHTTDEYDYGNADRGVQNNVTPRTTAAACTPIETLPRRVIEHSLTDCCSNNMCDDGYLCRNFNYALKCYPADDQPRNYPKVCNDQPVEGYCKEEGQGGRIELTCKQIDDLGNTLDIIIDNPNTNCISNEDCKMIGYDNYKCRFFQYFLACDTPANFLGVYPALCNAANTDEN